MDTCAYLDRFIEVLDFNVCSNGSTRRWAREMATLHDDTTPGRAKSVTIDVT